MRKNRIFNENSCTRFVGGGTLTNRSKCNFHIFLTYRHGFQGPGVGLPVLSINIIQLSTLIVLLRLTNY